MSDVVSGVVRCVVVSLAVVLGASACALLAAAPAEGHTDFIGAEPRDGVTLREVPRDVQLEFSDAMDPSLSTVTVEIDGGVSSRLELTTGAQKSVLVAATPSSLIPAPGTTTRWTIRFRVVSRDGHPVTGTTAFVVWMNEPQKPSAVSPSSPGSAASDSLQDSGPESGPVSAEDSGDGASAWPLLAIGAAVLALLALAAGAVMRLAGRGFDT